MKKKATTKEVKDSSPHVHQRDKIGFDLDIKHRSDLTDRQKEFIDLVLDKKSKMIFVKGPAGTSKTYVSILAGLILLQARRMSDIIYIRSIAESASKDLGSLPGEIGSKISPFLMPLMDKLDELLPKAQVDRLIKEERVHGLPINYVRGASYAAKVVVADEAQNLNESELTTLISRIGEYSKFILCGDPFQSDIGRKTGFMNLYNLFNDDESKENGIFTFEFTKEDIVRSGVLRYIMEKLENARK